MIARSAIGSVYADHGSWLQRWLSSRTRCPHSAADLAQDTFCRLLETGLPTPLRDVRNYLSVVARRLLIDDIRRRDIERAYLQAVSVTTGHCDELTPERIVAAVALLDGLVQLLDGLTGPVREAFLLRRIDGLTHEQIADRLSVSDRTVKRYIAQAYAVCYDFAYPD
ncbi:sigma-70 family RNA polymerase sigma factor [Novosphingobium gossypii]|uniref:sigma-70 family RNA polymerase sigma factor n=1 Tax=Novosphingobium gossypii TaxID=1604774 RepID=UPI003D19DAF7